MYFKCPNDHKEITVDTDGNNGFEVGEGNNMSPKDNNDKKDKESEASTTTKAGKTTNPFPEIVEEKHEVSTPTTGQEGYTTRSRRTFSAASCYESEFGGALIMAPEKKYYKGLLELACRAIDINNAELACVEAASGGGFELTAELCPMKYDEAMAMRDKPSWINLVKEEWD